MIKLPFILNGKRVYGSERTLLTTSLDVEYSIPKLTRELVDNIVHESGHYELRKESTQSILSFLHRVGRNWRSDEYPQRALYVDRLCSALGYSRESALAEADWISAILSSHARMLDLIRIELGHELILDRWISFEEAELKALPLGQLVHIFPGNVPSSNITSLLRAIVTKNASVAKFSINDPFTALALAQSMMDVDPSHPVVKALSVLHWPHHSDFGVSIVRNADGIIAWGDSAAIEWSHQNTLARSRTVLFGPKWSMGVVGAQADMRSAALGAAHDISRYDQQACFSVRHIFVENSVLHPFLKELKDALVFYEKLLPPRILTEDSHAALNSYRLHEVFQGKSPYFLSKRAAIYLDKDPDMSMSLLDRTVYVHPFNDYDEIFSFISSDTQTVAFAPWNIASEMRDSFVDHGVLRFVELGLSNYFRIGGAHDGTRPLQPLVKYASTETPSNVYSKGMVLPFDQTSFLENRTFKDIVF